MRLPNDKILLVLLSGFGVWTLVEVTVFGIWEEPSLSVPYLYTGAGAWRTFLRGLIAFLLATASSIRLLRSGNRYRWPTAALVAVALPYIFYISVTKIERFAPGYSDERFWSVGSALLSEGRRTLNADQVAQIVGRPLLVDEFQGNERWSYSYMPSSGIGWSKRILFFDEHSTLVDWVYLDEP